MSSSNGSRKNKSNARASNPALPTGTSATIMSPVASGASDDEAAAPWRTLEGNVAIEEEAEKVALPSYFSSASPQVEAVAAATTETNAVYSDEYYDSTNSNNDYYYGGSATGTNTDYYDTGDTGNNNNNNNDDDIHGGYTGDDYEVEEEEEEENGYFDDDEEEEEGLRVASRKWSPSAAQRIEELLRWDDDDKRDLHEGDEAGARAGGGTTNPTTSVSSTSSFPSRAQPAAGSSSFLQTTDASKCLEQAIQARNTLDKLLSQIHTEAAATAATAAIVQNTSASDDDHDDAENENGNNNVRDGRQHVLRAGINRANVGGSSNIVKPSQQALLPPFPPPPPSSSSFPPATNIGGIPYLNSLPCTDNRGKPALSRLERAVFKCKTVEEYVSVLGGDIFPPTTTSASKQEDEQNNHVRGGQQPRFSRIVSFTTLLQDAEQIQRQKLLQKQEHQDLQQQQKQQLDAHMAEFDTPLEMPNNSSGSDIDTVASTTSSNKSAQGSSPILSYTLLGVIDASRTAISVSSISSSSSTTSTLVSSSDSNKDTSTDATSTNSPMTYIINGTSVLFAPSANRLVRTIAETVLNEDFSIPPATAHNLAEEVLKGVMARDRVSKIAYNVALRLAGHPSLALLVADAAALPSSSVVPPMEIAITNGFHGDVFGLGASIQIPTVFTLKQIGGGTANSSASSVFSGLRNTAAGALNSIITSTTASTGTCLGKLLVIVSQEVSFEHVVTSTGGSNAALSSSSSSRKTVNNTMATVSTTTPGFMMMIMPTMMHLNVCAGSVHVQYFPGDELTSSRNMLAALPPAILQVMLAAPMPDLAIRMMSDAVEQIARQARDKALAKALLKKRRRRGSIDIKTEAIEDVAMLNNNNGGGGSSNASTTATSQDDASVSKTNTLASTTGGSSRGSSVVMSASEINARAGEGSSSLPTSNNDNNNNNVIQPAAQDARKGEGSPQNAVKPSTASPSSPPPPSAQDIDIVIALDKACAHPLAYGGWRKQLNIEHLDEDGYLISTTTDEQQYTAAAAISSTTTTTTTTGKSPSKKRTWGFLTGFAAAASSVIGGIGAPKPAVTTKTSSNRNTSSKSATARLSGTTSRASFANSSSSSPSIDTSPFANSQSNNNNSAMVPTAYTQAYAWGRAEYGVLGIGAGGVRDSSIPIPIPFASEVGTWRIKTIVCGWYHTVALTDVGLVYTWGSGSDGQLGHGDTLTCGVPRLLDFFGLRHPLIVTAIAAGSDPAGSHTLAVARGYLANDDEIDAEDDSESDSDVEIASTTASTATPAGVESLGRLGEVGHRSGRDVAEVGRVFAWGIGSACGTGGITNVMTPKIVRAGLSDMYAPSHGGVLSVTAGGGFSMALTRSGAVYSWGKFANGRLGLGMPPLSRHRGFGGAKRFVKFSLTPGRVTKGWAVQDEAVATAAPRSGDGSVATTSITAAVAPPTMTTANTSTNDPLSQQAKNPSSSTSSSSSSHPPPLIETLPNAYGPRTRPVRWIAAGEAHAVAIDAYGMLWSWGKGASGQTGLGLTADVLVPRQLRVLRLLPQSSSVPSGRKGSISASETNSLTSPHGSRRSSVSSQDLLARQRGTRGSSHSKQNHQSHRAHHGRLNGDSASVSSNTSSVSRTSFSFRSASSSVVSTTSSSRSTSSSSSKYGGIYVPVRFTYVSCGANHSLAIALDGSLYSWGGGGGTMLGHGDARLREGMKGTPASVLARVRARQEKALAKAQRAVKRSAKRDADANAAAALPASVAANPTSAMAAAAASAASIFGLGASSSGNKTNFSSSATNNNNTDDDDDDDDSSSSDGEERNTVNNASSSTVPNISSNGLAKPVYKRLGWKRPWLVPRLLRVFDGSVSSMQVAAAGGGTGHSWALTTNGRLFVWGENTSGVLGMSIDDMTHDEPLPRLVGVTYSGGLSNESDIEYAAEQEQLATSFSSSSSAVGAGAGAGAETTTSTLPTTNKATAGGGALRSTFGTHLRVAADNVIVAASGGWHMVAVATGSVLGESLRAAWSLGSLAALRAEIKNSYNTNTNTNVTTSSKKQNSTLLSSKLGANATSSSSHTTTNQDNDHTDDKSSVVSAADFLSGRTTHTETRTGDKSGKSRGTGGGGGALNKVQGYDVTLLLEGRAIKAHRAILAARSPVFATRLATETRPGRRGRLHIADMTFDIAAQILEFIYTDDLSLPLSPLAPGLRPLANAAAAYGVTRLGLICSVMLEAPVNYWVRQLKVISAKDDDDDDDDDDDEDMEERKEGDASTGSTNNATRFKAKYPSAAIPSSPSSKSSFEPDQLLSPSQARERQMRSAILLSDVALSLPHQLLKGALLSPLWSDTMFIAQGWRFPAHAVIVCASCEYFRVLLADTMIARGSDAPFQDSLGLGLDSSSVDTSRKSTSSSNFGLDGGPVEIELPDSAMTTARLLYYAYTGWLAPLPRDSTEANDEGFIPGIRLPCFHFDDTIDEGEEDNEEEQSQNKDTKKPQVVPPSWTPTKQLLLDLVAADRYGLHGMRTLLESAADVSPAEAARVLELTHLVVAPRLKEAAMMTTLSALPRTTASASFDAMKKRSPWLVAEVLDRAMERNDAFYGVLAEDMLPGTGGETSTKNRDSAAINNDNGAGGTKPIDSLHALLWESNFPWIPLGVVAVLFLLFLTVAEYNTAFTAFTPILNMVAIGAVLFMAYKGVLTT